MARLATRRLRLMSASLRTAAPQDEAARVRLAARETTAPSVLRSLADDAAITVRAAVALNPAMAPAADRRLLADPDERVRALLGGKLVTLLPGLTGTEHAEAQAHVHATLLALAGDAAIRVRCAISEALTAMPEAPREVILRLANDPVAAVSDPILRLSPLLNDDDLMQLLATPAHEGAAPAIASRPGLSTTVSDHIAHHADSAAVRALLHNHSAAIQESTLDALVGRADEHPEWHEPLAHRPSLSLGAIRALSRFVASHIIDALAARPELPASMISELRARTQAGLDDAPRIQSDADILENIHHMASAGTLSEDMLIDTLKAGAHREAAVILAVASNTTLACLDRAIALRNAKAMISLVWKAGFSMRAAALVQASLGQLAPSEILHPAQHGAFPLSANEMEWQIELMAEPGR